MPTIQNALHQSLGLYSILFSVFLFQCLSEKNDWKDEHGRVYQYFTIHQAQELLHFGHEKVCRLFAELDAADLIVRRRQGQGKANRIYLKEFTQKSDFRNSRSPGIGRK